VNFRATKQNQDASTKQFRDAVLQGSLESKRGAARAIRAPLNPVLAGLDCCRPKQNFGSDLREILRPRFLAWRGDKR
jgi:hypothetical protein